MQAMFRAIAFSILLISISGCSLTAPIANVQGEPLPPGASKLSLDEIARQIKLAGDSLRWQFDDAGPGKLRGTLHVRQHVAVVDVLYNQQSYSIMLASSVNLMQDSDGTIHRRYNDWIANLRNRIDSQLSLAGLQRS